MITKVKVFATLVLLTILSLGTFATDYYTATTNLNIRSGEGTEYPVLFELNEGEEVELISQDNSWDKIKYNGQTGYASSKYLQFERTTNAASTDTETNNYYAKRNIYLTVGLVVVLILIIGFLTSSSKNKSEPQTNFSPQMVRQQSRPRVIVTKSTKSVGIAVLLVFIFGPFGMFYSTIGGAILMIVAIPIIYITFFYFGISGNIGGLTLMILCAIIYYPVCMIWAGLAASSYNKRIINEANDTKYTETLPFQNNNTGTATQLIDVIYLKNGVVIKGTIIDSVPDVSIKIKSIDGYFSVHKMEEIEKMNKEFS